MTAMRLGRRTALTLLAAAVAGPALAQAPSTKDAPYVLARSEIGSALPALAAALPYPFAVAP